jgi:hypothetical protein
MHRFTLHLAVLALLAWPLAAVSPTGVTATPASTDLDITAVRSGVPTPPSNLTAQGGSGSVDLTWTDNSGDEYYFEIFRQVVYAYTFYDGAYQDTESYTDTGAGEYSRLCYKVRAVNGYGASDFSNEACADVWE